MDTACLLLAVTSSHPSPSSFLVVFCKKKQAEDTCFRRDKFTSFKHSLWCVCQGETTKRKVRLQPKKRGGARFEIQTTAATPPPPRTQPVAPRRGAVPPRRSAGVPSLAPGPLGRPPVWRFGRRVVSAGRLGVAGLGGLGFGVGLRLARQRAGFGLGGRCWARALFCFRLLLDLSNLEKTQGV